MLDLTTGGWFTLFAEGGIYVRANPRITRHHRSVQALVLGVINLVLGLVLSATIVLACIPLFIWLYMIYLGVLAYQGKPFTVPVLTDFIKKQGWA